MRTATALVFVALVGASLTACSTNDGGCAATPSGSVSDSVNVTGAVGAEPTVEFSTPLVVEATQRTVEIRSETRDDVVDTGDEVSFSFVLYNGNTGALLTSTFGDEGGPATLVADEAQILPGLVRTLLCSAPGDRVTGVIPAAEAFQANGSPDLGVAAGESIVFVADIISVTTPVAPTPVPTRASGEPQPAVDGLPTVTLADDGAPTITIPSAAPPAELQIAVLQKADGAIVADGDSVTVQYVGVNWNTGVVFDQSWGRGAATFATNQVVSGFGQALVGQSVGSQVLVVIPPELGYGPAGGNPNAGIGESDTIVFVIDILATSSAG